MYRITIKERERSVTLSVYRAHHFKNLLFAFNYFSLSCCVRGGVDLSLFLYFTVFLK